MGGGASWAISDRLGIYGNYMRSIRGENGHKLDRGLSLGISYNPTLR